MKTKKTIRRITFSVILPGLIFSFSACSDFYHQQYKKVKKVPATGFVDVREVKESTSPIKVQPDSSFVPAIKIPEEQQDSALVLQTHKHGYDLLPAIKNEVVSYSQVKKWKAKTEVEKPAFQRNKPKSTLLIIGLLFIGFGLIIFGGSIIALAAFTSAWLMLLLGIAILLLGMFPFFVLLTYVVGKKHNPYKE